MGMGAGSYPGGKGMGYPAGGVGMQPPMGMGNPMGIQVATQLIS